MRLRCLVFVVAAGLLAAGCGGSDGDREVSFGPETDEESLASSEETTTTTETETTTTTEAETTTTVDPAVEAEQLIREAAVAHYEVWVKCSDNPESCDAEAEFAEVLVVGSDWHRRTISAIEEWAARGEIAALPEGREDNDFYFIEDVRLADDLMSATVVRCTRDGRADYLPDPTGGYSLIEGSDDEAYYLAEEDFVLQDGRWLHLEARQLEKRLVGEGEPLCGPETS